MADRIRRIFLSSSKEPQAGDYFPISSQEAQHLLIVLRHQSGDSVEVAFPSHRLVFLARIESALVENCVIQLLSKIDTSWRQSPVQSLVFALCKGDTNSWVVEKATELGVSHIILWQASRSVLRLDKKQQEAKLLRFQKIAHEAAKQSQGAQIPQLSLCENLSAAFRLLESKSESLDQPQSQNRFICSLRDGAKPFRDYPPPEQDLAILIGPEGDFTEEELVLAEKNFFRPVRLTASILRSETAAISAIAQAEALWGKN